MLSIESIDTMILFAVSLHAITVPVAYHLLYVGHERLVKMTGR